MTLQFTDGRAFARGACRFQARPATSRDVYVRPFLAMSVEGQLLDAALDTGGFFLILNAELAELLSLHPSDGEPFSGLLIRGVSYNGHSHRVTLTLEAERGDSFDVEVIAFVPIHFGDYPNFIGWSLCLERFRFAFEPNASDPTDGWFHFGPIDQM